MVTDTPPPTGGQGGLSVLALSSRFDGPVYGPRRGVVRILSVLALSSRFDGLRSRLVSSQNTALSVLALSSRFDGHAAAGILPWRVCSFSTRSVESF